MSLTTWKEEFYPVDASEVSEVHALRHSHRKWLGLRAKNLKKHGVSADGRHLSDDAGQFLAVDGDSCALCWRHLNGESCSCCNCPLYQANDDRPCDSSITMQYQTFAREGDPEPMIALIEKALSSTVAEAATPSPEDKDQL